MALNSYSPEDVVVLLAGIIPVDGFLDGTFISIKKNTQPFTTSTSADGVNSRLFINNQTYTVTLTLASYSTSNNILNALRVADEITQQGKFPLLIKDTNGTSLFAAATCYIEQIPETTYSNEITARTWVIYACQAVYSIGGSSDASNLLDDLANGAISSLPLVQDIIRG